MRESLGSQQNLGIGANSPSSGGAFDLSLGARCDGFGASAMPLDLYSSQGGSVSLGGPVDDVGHLLVRHRILLSDIHDGRRKLFMMSRGDSFLRAAVVSADAASVEFLLEDAQHRMQAIDSHWSHGTGWSFAKRISAGGLWLSF